MNQRCTKIKFTQSFSRKKAKFPFSAVDFAHMIKFMSDRRLDFVYYKPPVDEPKPDAKVYSIFESNQPKLEKFECH